MRIQILAFAGVREIVGAERTLEVSDGDTAGRAWDELARKFPRLVEIEGSIRLARNGAFVDRDAALRDGDILAIMPPFGGG